MDKKWRHRRSQFVPINLLCILWCASAVKSCSTNNTEFSGEEGVIDRELKKYVDRVLSVDTFNIIPGFGLERTATSSLDSVSKNSCASPRSLESVEEYARRKLKQFTETHVLAVNVPQTARFLFPATSAEKSGGTFMAGFGMGFLAFALKKLLLPVFLAAQLFKSVMLAMFLPSILGSLGKIVGKGLSTVSGISGASGGVNGVASPQNEVEDFEFKDTSPYNNEDAIPEDDLGMEPDPLDNTQSIHSSSTIAPSANSRFGTGSNRIGPYTSHQAHLSDTYYLRRPNKKTDYKVFHKIPTSSLLLTSYDPFYSPLLSRLDSVFHQLGLGDDKSPQTERCRERLVCMMYANPAKYAPYSNLVSAQLSRELNELRKPASDNPDILRFFRYMKAAKDGQDGEECLNHGGCSELNASKPSPAMLTTFNHINKLVQARKFN